MAPVFGFAFLKELSSREDTRVGFGKLLCILVFLGGKASSHSDRSGTVGLRPHGLSWVLADTANWSGPC